MKISIVTPSYNQVQFIERTMQSVLSQTGDFVLEYIVMDGGSTDGSLDIIQRLAAQDARVIWRSGPDKGQSDAINQGLQLATGEIVAFLNSDDIYYPGTLELVAKTFRNPTVNWLYGRCRVIDEQDQEMARPITWYKNILGFFYSYWSLLVLNYISQPATFWRRKLMQELGVLKTEEHLVMDYELWCRFGRHYRATAVHQYLAGFRLYATSKSGQRYQQQFKDQYRVATQYTRNPIVLGLQRLHNWLIVTIYRFTR